MKKIVLVVAVIAIILSMTLALTACEPQYTLDVTGRPLLEEVFSKYTELMYLHDQLARDDYIALLLVKVGDVLGGATNARGDFPATLTVEVEVVEDVLNRGFSQGETVSLAFSCNSGNFLLSDKTYEESAEIMSEWVTQQEYLLVQADTRTFGSEFVLKTLDTTDTFVCDNMLKIDDIFDLSVVGIHDGKVDFDGKEAILKDICPDGEYAESTNKDVVNWNEYISDGMTLETLQENLQTLAEEVQLTLASQQQ